MSTFPSILTSYTNPQATDKLNSPSHSGVETAQNSGLSQVEAVIGVEGASSVVGSLQYLIKSSASDGGGHVQSANKGGTGQTSYSKGDLLVGSSSSVLSKIAIGSDGTVPIADSTQSTGIGWGNVTAGLPYAQDGGTGSVFAISPVPCVLSYTPGQIYVAKITNTNTIVSPAISVSSLLAKKIVNLDRSSVLIGQIRSSSLSLFGYDATASVMELLNPYSALTFKSGVATHDVSVTGDQTITHGLPGTPKYIRISVRFQTGVSVGYFSDGTYDGTTTATVYEFIASANNSVNTDSTNIVNLPIPSNGVVATAAFNATLITLTWSKTNTPTGTALILWEAVG